MGADRARHVVLNYRPVAGKLLKGAKRAKAGRRTSPAIANVSALAPVDDDLWTASDEGAAIERLTRDTIGYGRARSWDLARLFPAYAAACEKARRAGKAQKKKSREADLEGLAFDPERRRLWVRRLALPRTRQHGQGRRSDAAQGRYAQPRGRAHCARFWASCR